MTDSSTPTKAPAWIPPPPPTRAPSLPAPPPAAQLPPSMASTGSYRARALAKVSKVASAAAPRIDSAMSTAKQSAVGRLTEFRDRQAEKELYGGRAQGIQTTSRNPAKQASIRSRDFVDPVAAAEDAGELSRSNTAEPKSRWYNYFTSSSSSSSSSRRDSSTYGEEKIVCFPGWATLHPSAHAASEPALILEIVAHGYAYRIRSVAQASRSQRIFYALAKSFASLPKVPAHLVPAGMDVGLQSTESLDIPKTEALMDGNVFEQLLEIGGREGGRAEEAELTEATILAAEPEEMTEEEEALSPTKSNFVQNPSAPIPVGDSTDSTETSPIIPSPAKVQRRPHIRTTNSYRNSSISSLPSSPTSPVARKHPASATRSRPASVTSSAASSRANSPTRSGTSTPLRSGTATPSTTLSHDDWPKPFAFVEKDLPRLHATLQARLMPFWGFKLGGRKVRLTVFPVLGPGRLWDKPLATKVVSTTSGGAFKTTLEVRSRELRRLLDETGQGVESLDKLSVRVVAELLEVESVGDMITGGKLAHQGLKVMAEDDTELVVAQDGGVRVISDIDDTIKWTQVLGGTKTIFRNVFVRELEEIRVPGMATWYQEMKEVGAHFHFVSNSPWELWPVVRAFLSSSNFPTGSVTLKEYGGASSAIAKLWEEPGMRKRAGVENIIKEFKHSRFILIGDSGEQDLNLYVQLACEYPENVLAIYIRDVTTPFKPDSHPDLTHGSSPALSHSHSLSDLTKATDSPSLNSKTGRPPLPTLFSETPDLPGQFDGSHERPLPARAPAREKPSRSHSSFTRRGTTSAPPSPPLVDHDVDPLSPNNPLRTETLKPTQTEEEAALVEAFYQRVLEAEKILPRHVPLRLFRHGAECAKEGVEIVKKANGWQA